MNHIHLNSIPSTQDYLMDNFENPKEGILVSTNLQTQGKGQYERAWKQFEGSLAFSFTLAPNPVITLSSLEIPVLIRNYLKEKFNIETKFKWPNDLMNTTGEKIGGILINRQGNHDLVIGVGINLWPIEHQTDFLYKAGSLFKTRDEFDPKTLALEIYHYILNNRLGSSQIIKAWNESCIYLNQKVEIKENNISHHGVFQGLGDNGQALLFDGQKQLEIYTGSLFF